MTTNTTYHNNPLLKNEIVKRMAEHVEADTLVQGSYWNERSHKGCNIGCVLHSDDHSLFPERLGLPVWMAHLHDRMHEGLNLEDTRDFSKVYSVIPVGISWDQLELIKYKLLKYILVESRYCVKKYCDEYGKKATDTVVALITRAIAGDMPTEEEWRAAASFAYAAAYSAARTAAAYYAARAVGSAKAANYAADAANYAATYAADSAAARFSAAYFATKYAAMKDYAGYYMKLLSEMKGKKL
jgi:hypothetical protein